MGKCKNCRFFDYGDCTDLFGEKSYFCQAWELHENENSECYLFESVPELKRSSGSTKCEKCRYLDITDNQNYSYWGSDVRSKCLYRYEYVKDDNVCDMFEAPAPLQNSSWFDNKCEECVHSSYNREKEVYFCHYRNTNVRSDNKCAQFAKPPELLRASSDEERCKRCCHFDQFDKKLVEKGVFIDTYHYYCKKTHRYVSEKAVCTDYRKYKNN